ncbi:LD-carboxypeptidase [Paludibacter sp.]
MLSEKKQTICIVSPSGAVNPDYIDGAKLRLQSWGFEVKEGKYTREKFGRYAGTEEQRISDLQDAIDDENNDFILCSRGGYGVSQMIDKLDFSPLKKKHKWLIGFSDISIIHAALSNIEIPSVHAVMTKQIATLDEDCSSLTYLKAVLHSASPIYKVPSHPFNIVGNTQGKLIGGNLSVIAGLRGTPYDLNYDDAVLFIEDVGEEPYKIDRLLQNFRLGGVFDKIAGLIVGHFSDYKEDFLMNKTLMEIIRDIASEYKFPVCFGFPAGHEDENYPLILGGKAKLDVTKSETILEFV